MAGKTTAKPKVKNGVDKKEPVLSMTYIDDILLRQEKLEEDIDEVERNIGSLETRVGKVEARLGLG